MSELTQDEYTVLLLMAQGESISAIGRWEKPLDRLVELGLAARHDKFNNIITSKGRVAAEQRENEDDKAMDNVLRKVIDKNNTVATARQQVLPMGEQAADLLVAMVRASVAANGDSVEHAAREWSRQILVSALEKLKCG